MKYGVCFRQPRHRAFTASRRPQEKKPGILMLNAAGVNHECLPMAVVLPVSVEIIKEILENQVLKKGKIITGHKGLFNE